MIRTTEECQEYYAECLMKKRRFNHDRIFMYLYRHCSEIKAGTTWHQLVDQYFFVREGDRYIAIDGGRPIPWQSVASPISRLRTMGYIIETTWKLPDPITKNPAARLYPANVPEAWWKYEPPKKML